MRQETRQLSEGNWSKYEASYTTHTLFTCSKELTLSSKLGRAWETMTEYALLLFTPLPPSTTIGFCVCLVRTYFQIKAMFSSDKVNDVVGE